MYSKVGEGGDNSEMVNIAERSGSDVIEDFSTAVRRASRAAPERSNEAANPTESHAQIRHLAGQLRSIREDERTKIAREIHDELGQNLIALKIDLSRISERISKTTVNDGIVEQLNATIGLVSSTIGTLKQICTNLRPLLLDPISIGPAIEMQAREFQKRSGVECEVAVASDFVTTDMDIATTLFRIFQEALTNVLKHSKATKVEASLRKESDNIVLEIHDNGVGITEKQVSKLHSFGLLGMRERLYPFGGKILINGNQQTGTTLAVSIPLHDTDDLRI